MNKKLNATDINRLLGTPISTIRDWKKEKKGNHRKNLIDFLLSLDKSVLIDYLESKGEQVPTFKDKRFRDNN